MNTIVVDRYRRALDGVDEVVARIGPDRWDSLSSARSGGPATCWAISLTASGRSRRC